MVVFQLGFALELKPSTTNVLLYCWGFTDGKKTTAFLSGGHRRVLHPSLYVVVVRLQHQANNTSARVGCLRFDWGTGVKVK